MSNNWHYYQEMKKVAGKVRENYNITSCRVIPQILKRILKTEGVEHIDYRTNFKKVRGVYFNDEYGVSIEAVS